MKGKTAFLSLFALLVVGLMALALLCDQEGSTRERAAAPASYRLDIVRMTGTDTHTLELEAGDTLQVQFETIKGSMHMEIKAPDGTTLYAGNGKAATDFTINISEGGSYSVVVKTYHAKGTIQIQRKENRT